MQKCVNVGQFCHGCIFESVYVCLTEEGDAEHVSGYSDVRFSSSVCHLASSAASAGHRRER